MRRTLIATAALAALAAGCGSQEAGPGVASVAAGASRAPSAAASPTGTADPEEQGRKFAQCMREHGVPMEDPDPNGGGGLKVAGEGIDKTKVQDAIKDCRAYAPFKDRKELKPDEVEKMREFAKCMRDNGVDVPDPNPDGTFASGSARNFKRDDPQFDKAFKACGAKFPKMGASK
ncbi:hypothetical protein ABZ897_51670 [Nonomuraea sp. NPDC046802]|uniref:hypothetical protein n=1 Tax=Nonomuraea sp. NPDC046802 TaxID=3154919 RepID=UPI0033C03DD0